MFKFWFKKNSAGKELHIAISTYLRNVEAEIVSEEWIKKQCQWQVENKAREEILRFVETEIDKEICRKIAADLLKDFDYKPVLEKAMIEKFEGYVRGSVAPPMDPYQNSQSLALLQSQYRRTST